MFTMVEEKFFNASPVLTLLDRLDYFFSDYFLVPLFIQENYPKTSVQLNRNSARFMFPPRDWGADAFCPGREHHGDLHPTSGELAVARGKEEASNESEVEHLVRLSYAADCISEGENVERRMTQRSQFGLLPVFGMLSCVA